MLVWFGVERRTENRNNANYRPQIKNATAEKEKTIVNANLVLIYLLLMYWRCSVFYGIMSYDVCIFTKPMEFK